MSDFRSLLTAARTGDRSARDRLFEQVYPKVRRMVHWSMATDVRVRRPWMTPLFSTGDVVQDVCRNVLRDFDAFQGDGEQAFVAYLSRVVHNRLVDAVRFHEAVRRDRRRIVGASDELELATPSRGPATQAVDSDGIDRFWRVLETFPSRERKLLRLRLEGERTFDELASRLGYGTPDAARKAFYAAQARLLLRMRQAGVMPETSS